MCNRNVITFLVFPFDKYTFPVSTTKKGTYNNCLLTKFLLVFNSFLLTRYTTEKRYTPIRVSKTNKKVYSSIGLFSVECKMRVTYNTRGV